MHLSQLAAKLLSGDAKEKIKNTLSNSDNLPKLTIADKESILCYFEVDTILLEKLIGRDLSA